MRTITLVLGLSLCAVLLLWAERGRNPEHPPFEVKAVFPRETSPGQFRHVEQWELQDLADQGWELVSVMPYVYRNEEHGDESNHPRPVVTQTYPAYFFKRPKIVAK